MYVCMYVRMYVCMYIDMHTYICGYLKLQAVYIDRMSAGRVVRPGSLLPSVHPPNAYLHPCVSCSKHLGLLSAGAGSDISSGLIDWLR